ncbi:MAG: division/cell wall cluster transcriptional repressor MraZ [Pseudolysinimonas sp.]|uniref:division/cell wall cluster transcriptional repressor MraZ n=1 Tax=Pseudolysinimonas sp. TaxID=2680009 RepID=UPI003266D390
MLLGTFAPKLDEKGRVILPAKFWDEFSGGLVMTRGVDRCVVVYSEREFEKVLDAMNSAPVTTTEQRDQARFFMSGASQEIPDKQRRVTIPSILRDYASLDRELTMIGVGTRAEIWDSQAWETFYAAREATYAAGGAGEVIAGPI